MQRRGIVIALAVALFLACFVSYSLFVGVSDCCTNYRFVTVSAVGHGVLSYFSHLFLVAAKTGSPSRFYSNRSTRRKKAENNCASVRLSVFKGREASLNRAIFTILAMEGPKTIIELQKQLSKQKRLHGTYYASINKRIHCLEKEGYVSPIQTSQPALKAVLYELRPKALLATFMSKKSPEEVLNQITDKDATIILSDLIQACLPNDSK